jgi:hypothetical protein
MEDRVKSMRPGLGPEEQKGSEKTERRLGDILGMGGAACVKPRYSWLSSLLGGQEIWALLKKSYRD